MNFTPVQTADFDGIHAMRSQLYKLFTAPIDGMWEALYIPASTSYMIQEGQHALGYCCIDDDHSLTQLFMKKGAEYRARKVVQELISLNMILSAKLSSIEPITFNACLSLSMSNSPHTFCYQYNGNSKVGTISSPLAPVLSNDIVLVKDFLKDQVGFEDNFGYTENLVNCGEIYAIQDGPEIIATGECRLSDTQENTADIGMIVNRSHQGKGLGAEVLHQLAQKACALKRMPICSTTRENIPSQKSIEKAGFYCSHIIFDIKFTRPHEN